MTYTSFEGGWQIKQSDGLSPAEQDDLVRRAPTRLSLIDPLPRFPSADELDALPRRLVYERHGRGAVFLHAAQAGDDGAGRPGNVFTHAVLLRQRADAPALRPIELWRSPQWLTPFGQSAVRSAEYDVGCTPGSHPGTSRDEAVDFVLDPSAYRFPGMSLLLDAVAQVLGGGRSVVLLAGDVDEGARWISLLSWMGAAASLQALTFSTYERGSDVLAGVEHLLSVVVRGDLDAAAAAGRDLLVVDPTWECELVDDGGRERLLTPAGQEVDVTAWSGLALDVLAEGQEVALDILQKADAIAAQAPSQAAACAWWPLAVAVARTPQLSVAWPLAARVVVSQTLDRALPEDLREDCTELVRRSSGDTADEAWALLQHCSSNEALLSIVYPAYVERVLAEPHLLVQELRRPLPLTLPPEQVLTRLVGLAARALEGSRQVPPPDVPEDDALGRLLYELRLLDFVVRAGIPLSYLDEVVAAVADDVAAALLSDTAPELLTRCGPVSAATWKFLVVHLSARLPGVPRPPGQRLARPVRRALEAAGMSLPLVGELTLAKALARPVPQEVAVGACRDQRWPHDFLRSMPLGVLLLSAHFAPELGGQPRLRVERALAELDITEALVLDEVSELLDLLSLEPKVDLLDQCLACLQHLEFPGEGAHLAATLLRSPWVQARGHEPGLVPQLELFRRMTPENQQAEAKRWDEVAQLVLAGLRAWEHLLPTTRQRLAPHLLVAAFKITAWRHDRGWQGRGVDPQVLARGLQERERQMRGFFEAGTATSVQLLVDQLGRPGSTLLDDLLTTCRQWLLDDGTSRGWVRGDLLFSKPPDGDGATLVELVLRKHWSQRDPKASQARLTALLAGMGDDDARKIKAWWTKTGPQSGLLSRHLPWKGSS